MSKNAAAVVVSVLAAIGAAVAIALRLARTEHPPVSAQVPRIDDLG
ncbi:MAG: hypothetical protein WAW85_08130 [Gordonia sp. (in: high G+C Gram-positive bacteria)]